MLVYLERYPTAAEARAREQQFKGGRTRKKTILLLINTFWGKRSLCPRSPVSRVKGQPRNFVKMTVALWPPKPRELERTLSTGSWRAWLGT